MFDATKRGNGGVMKHRHGVWRVAVCGLILCCSVPLLHAAMDIRGYAGDPSRYDRFDGSNDDFLGRLRDFSGVGMDGSHFATMVSPSFFLSANHYHPGDGAILTFYGDNDPSGSPITATVAGGQRIDSTDLWLGWVDSPLPAGIATYPVYENIDQAFRGQEVWAIGKDSSSTSTQNQRLGRNVIDGVGTLDELFVNGGAGSEELAVFSYETAADSAVGGDEFRYVSGDSGGPTFVLVGDTFSLLGTNYFIYDPATDLVPYATVHDPSLTGSGSTFVPAYIDDINAAMAAQDTATRQERLTVVPEPSSTILLAFGLLLLGSRRRKALS